MGSLLTTYEWKTPCSGYKPESIGNFHIVRRTIPSGTALGVDAMSIDAVVFRKPTDCIMLREGKKDGIDVGSLWMSDTPKEYYMAWELVVRARGDVLVGGLGLGLLVHLLRLRKDIGRITVIEKSSEVVQMVSKYMPSDVEIICDDFVYQMQILSEKGIKFDTVIADMWKTGEEKDVVEDCKAIVDDCYPNAVKLFWALQEEIDNDNAKLGLFNMDEKEREMFQKTAMRVMMES